MSDLPPGREGPLDEPEPVAPHRDDGRRGSLLVAAGIFLSRIAGLVREVAISAYLGVGATADVFKAALRIPNLLQNLLGEGVLSASFIPVYARALERDRRDAQRVAGAVLGLLLVLLAALVVVGILLARPLTLLITPGFSGERLDLAVTLLRIMFPGIAFLVLSAFCLGVLNSHREFFLSYVAPVVWNVAQVAFLVVAALWGAGEVGMVEALAWGVVAGGVAQTMVQVPAVRRLTRGMRPSLDHRSPEVRSVLDRFVPVVVGRGVVQLLSYVDLVLASLLAVGAVSALTYGQVLYLLPISLFGMAVAAAELPELSRLGRSGREEVVRRLVAGLDRITFYVAPVAVLYVFVGDVIVGALLERGEFDAADSRLVWFVIAAFAVGLLGTTRSRLLQNGLYALDRPKLVARISVLRVALAAGLGAILMFPLDRWAIVGTSVGRDADLGFTPLPDGLRLVTDGPPRLGAVGLALGAAASSWVEYRILRRALEWRVGRLPGTSPAAAWCLVAAVASGILAAGIRAVTDDLHRLLAVVVVCGPAVATYLAVTVSVAVPEATALLDRVRRR